MLVFAGCDKQEAETTMTPPKEEDTKLETPQEDIRVSFLAVGDNLIHNTVYWDPACQKGDTWDYSGMYTQMLPYLEGKDVKNINQETPLGGRDLGLSNYPQFNGPTEIGDAVVKTGFNWISQASNHAIDAGEQGIINQMAIWDGYEDVISTGMNRTQEEAQTPRILEVKGMKIGLLNYTYGLNGLSLPEGKEYMVNMIDEAKIKADIASLKESTDVIVASMHWGQEYQFTPDAQQKQLAQLLSDEGVSIIIGAHPHVIEPMEYITSKTGEKTLVMYSLGNFISSQDVNYGMLGGMATWEIIKDGESGSISIEQAKFYPTVTHFDKKMQNFKTYALKDYTDDLASQHYLSSTISRQYFIDLSNEVIGQPENIEVIH